MEGRRGEEEEEEEEEGVKLPSGSNPGREPGEIFLRTTPFTDQLQL